MSRPVLPLCYDRDAATPQVPSNRRV